MHDITNNTEYFKPYSSEFDEDSKNQWSVSSKKLWDLVEGNNIEKWWIAKDSQLAKDRSTSNLETLKYISEGDYFRTKSMNGYHRIIYSDSLRVWALQELKKKDDEQTSNYILKSYLRSEIESGIVFPFESSKEVIEIINLANEDEKTIGSDSVLSTFYDPVIVKDGDFVVITSKDFGKLYGKVIDLENKIAVLWNKRNNTWEKRSYERFDVKFMSKDPRINKSSIYNMMSNLWKVYLGKKNLADTSLQHTRTVSYVVSKDVSKETVDSKMKDLLPETTYTNIGKYIEQNQMEDKWVDKTNELIKLLGGDPESNNLYVDIVENTMNTYKRDFENARLRQITGIEYLSEEFIKQTMLFKGAYISIYKESFADPTLYVIERVTDTDVYARQYFRNKFGDVLMSEVKLPIINLVDRKIDSKGKHVRGSLARYYLQHGNNNKFSEIVTEIKDKRPKDLNKKIKKQDRDSLKEKIENLFSKLNVSVEYSSSSKDFLGENQKAKFVTTVNDTETISKIIIKKDIGGREDVVHEAMHLFLAALRYISPEAYMKVLNSIEDVDSLNQSLIEKEENFIHSIEKNLSNLQDVFFTPKMDLSSLLEGLNQVAHEINPEFLDKGLNQNIYDILNTPLVEFLQISEIGTHQMMNTNLAQITPAFMRWLEENNYNLKCD